MKIAILTSGILPIPSVQGGAVENLVDIYMEYNNRHHLHDITVYSIGHPDAAHHPAIFSSVNHYHFIDTISIKAKIKRKIYQLTHCQEQYNYFIEYFFEQAWKNIRKQHYDCIILENRPGYAYKLSKRGYKNIILHLHNDLLNNETPHHKEIFSSINKILTVSNFIKQRVLTIQLSSKVKVIHNGIDLQLFSSHEDGYKSRTELGFASNDVVLVFSGRINHEKGISELIDAMLILKDLPNLKLMIIGSTFFGNAKNEDDFVRSIKEKAKHIENKIVFTGFIPYSNMPSYLQIADIAIIPSVWDDPFPTTVLEAQAMGLPIIASDRGGIPEEINLRNAIVVQTGKNYISRLADAILYLYDHPEVRISMGAASLEHSKYFNKDRFAQDFFNALENKL